MEDEGLLPTHHQKIRVFAGAMKPWEQIGMQLASLRKCCQSCDLDESISTLTNLVPDYIPSVDLSRKAAAQSVGPAARAFEAV